MDIIGARLAQAQATLALSRIQLQRQQALFAKKTVPRASLDEARTVVERERARVSELRAQLATAHLAARSDAIRAAEAQVEAARATLAQVEWELAQKTRQAPDDAMVVDTFFEPGECRRAGPLCPCYRRGISRCAFTCPRRHWAPWPSATRWSFAATTVQRIYESKSVHLAGGGIHTTGDLQSRDARQTRVSDRGAA